ncbi:hypothetical protein DL93DRAFT_2078756 [Clavulina sp. PMI_390]|nr:hypothetical protein DL93DRAFT_2078756 [Clavulina sp. PMI_390]
MSTLLYSTSRLSWLVLAVAALLLAVLLAVTITSASIKHPQDVERDNLVLPVRMAKRPGQMRSLTFPPPSHPSGRPHAHRAALVMLYRVCPTNISCLEHLVEGSSIA